MKTEDEILAYYQQSDDMLGFVGEAILPFLSPEKVRPLLKEDADLSDWQQKPLTRESVIATMREYMEFSWEKVMDHRGISAMRSVEKMGAWLWLLGDEETQQFAEESTNYAQYGAPILKRICDIYGLPIPDEPMVLRMAQGLPCHDGCEAGCGKGPTTSPSVDEQGFMLKKHLPDERLLAIEPLIGGHARLGIGMLPPMHTIGVYADTWDFPSLNAAIQAFTEWNPVEQPEPTGWHRHPNTGRYRIGGDPNLEYVRSDGSREQQVRHAFQVTCGKDRIILSVADGGRPIVPPHCPDGTTVFMIESTSKEDPSHLQYNRVLHYLDRSVVEPPMSEEAGEDVRVVQRLMGEL